MLVNLANKKKKIILTLPVGHCCVLMLLPWHPLLSQRSSHCGLRKSVWGGLGTALSPWHCWSWTHAAATVFPSHPLPWGPPCQCPTSPPSQRHSPAAGSAAVGWWCGWWCGGTGLCRWTDTAAPPESSLSPGPVSRWGCALGCLGEARWLGKRQPLGEPPQWAACQPGTVTLSACFSCVPAWAGGCPVPCWFLYGSPWSSFPQQSERRNRRSEGVPWEPAGWPVWAKRKSTQDTYYS